MKLIINTLITAVALLIAAQFVPGFTITQFSTAVIAAIVLGLVNAIIRPIMLLLTLPVNIVTLGLFTLIVNALMFLLAASIVSGFAITGLIPALIGSIVVSLVSSLLGSLFNSK